MTNTGILKVALAQSAIDSGCRAEDFLAEDNKMVLSRPHPDARKYLQLPFDCDLTSYGNNIVASVSQELWEPVWQYIEKYPVEHCFETPNLHVLLESLRPFGKSACFMAEYFLPDLSALQALDCAYAVKMLQPADFAGCYLPQWSNALCEKRRQLDAIAAGAFDDGRLIGLAGASADCDTMWQIGVDVLPAYRKRGVASCLTSRLAIEILKRGKVPFYCCAWSNVKSARNAIKSGFRPAWVQLTVKGMEEIAALNR